MHAARWGPGQLRPRMPGIPRRPGPLTVLVAILLPDGCPGSGKAGALDKRTKEEIP